MPANRTFVFLLLALTLVLALPVLGVGAAWLGFDDRAQALGEHLARTVLPRYAASSALLCLFVGVGVAVVGGGSAAAVGLFDFPGRRWLEWALLLPMAMPAYVAAYAYTDALQFSGPLQTALRELLGARGPLWPDVRSLPGAVALFVLCLYPYAYLLTRTALIERGAGLMEAARMLGASVRRRVLGVALPLARPALAAGLLLAVMETLADYGVGAYFGLTTLTTGIYKAWLVHNDALAAAQLATVLLAIVALLLGLERRAESRLRFAQSKPGGGAESRRIELSGARGWGLFVLCALPVLLGFALPVLALARLLWIEWRFGEFGLPLARFAGWAWSSLQLAGLAALLTVALALALSFALRVQPSGPGRRLLGGAAQIVGLGYAVPGAVIAVGILGPLAWAQQHWPGLGLGALLSASSAGLVYAYVVRFSAVALQSVQAGYARVPLAVDESARLLGSSRWRMFRRLHAPLLARSSLAAALLVFVDVMKELPATLVLRPFNQDTLAVVAFQLARDERLGEAALPSLAIVAVGLAPVLLIWRAMRRG